MKGRKKKIVIFLAVAVVVILVVGNMLVSGDKTTEVQAAKVEVIDIVEEVSASGYVQPQTKVNITSEVTAEIIGIPVVDGQMVIKGQLLVMLDTVQLQKDADQYRYSLNEIEARTEAARANFLQAEEEFDRQKQLYERNLTSETAFKDAQYGHINYKYSYEAMVSQTNQARARLEKAMDNLSKTRILAPMSGTITYLDAEVGEIAPAQTPYTQGKTLMTISNMSAFEVQVDVDETEIVKILNGQKAKIEVDAFPDTVFAGEVVEIGNTAIVTGAGSTDQSTNFKVKVLFTEANAKIRPGMSATADIVTNTRENALAVPYGAIVMRSLDADSLARAMAAGDDTSDISEGFVATAHAAPASDSTAMNEVDDEKDKKDIKGVFIVDGEKAKFIPVETGIADQKNIEITSGLKDDQTVITGPFRTLRSIKDGELIKTEMKNSKGGDK